MCKSVRTLIRNEDGPTAVEYAVALSLIVAVSLPAVKMLGSNSSSAFNNAAGSLGGSSASSSSSSGKGNGNGNNGNGNGNGGGNGSNGNGGGSGNSGS